MTKKVYDKGIAFTTLHFLRNLPMCSIGQCCIALCWMARQGQTIQLTWPIRELRRKLSIVNTAPEPASIKPAGPFNDKNYHELTSLLYRLDPDVASFDNKAYEEIITIFQE